MPNEAKQESSANEIFARIAICVERGKINRPSSHPPDMKGQLGACELVQNALKSGIPPNDLLIQGLMVGMKNIGYKFRENLVFVPDVLLAAKVMRAAMVYLKPYFQSGMVRRQGSFVAGTVSGDLHDVGKNLVLMGIEGAGWEVVDLGVDVPTQKFMTAIENHPGCAVGLSALITSTMTSMEKTVKAIKSVFPHTKVLVGGAPLTHDFAAMIGADFYSPDFQGAVEYLEISFPRIITQPSSPTPSK